MKSLSATRNTILKKHRLARNIAALFLSGIVCTTSEVQAATYYWDSNGTTAGFGTAGGTWAAPTTGSATQGWSTDATGVTLPANVTVATSDGENFGDATNGLATGIITVSGAVASGNMTFGASSGEITLNGGSIGIGASTITVNNTQDIINSTLTGGNALTKAGTGTLVLGGTNTRTGKLTITAGTISINSLGNYGVAGGLGAQASTTVDQLGNGNTSGTLLYTGAVTSTNRQFLIGNTTAANTGGGVINNTGTGALTFTATTFNPTITGITAARNLAFGGTGDIEVQGIIQNNASGGAITLTKNGSNILTLSGANTNTGAITVNAGTLTLSGAKTGASGTITVGSEGNTATLNLSNGNYALAGSTLFSGTAATAGTGTVNQSGGAVSFTSGNALLIGNGLANGIYNLSGGTITGTFTAASTTRGVMLGVNAGSSGTFNLSGTGSLSLSNTALQVGRFDSSASNTTTLYNQTGGTATVSRLSIGGNGTTSTGVNSTFTVTAGSFVANTFAGFGAGNTNTTVMNIGGTADVTLPAFPTTRGTSATATINFDGGTLKNLAASTTYMGGLTNAFIKAGGATFDTTAGSITVSQDLLTDVVSTGGGLTKLGSTTLSLTGASTYTGSTLISAGTLQIGANGTTGSLSPLSVITNNSTLSFNRSNTISQGTDFASVIAGTGAVAKNSTGLLALTGTNTYQGATTINNGTLQFSGTGSANSSSDITISGSGAKLLQTSSVAVAPAVTLTQGTLTGNGTINNVNVGNGTGGSISNNDGVAGASLTIGTLTFNGAATVNTFSSSTSAAIVTTTLASNAAGIVVINANTSSWTFGVPYNLISFTSGSIGGAGFSQFALGTVSNTTVRNSKTLADSGTAITLTVGAGDTPYWVGDGDGKWNLASTNNWKLLTANAYTTFLTGDESLFNDSATGSTTIDIDTANVAPNSTTFNNSTLNYTLSSSGGFGISSGNLIKTGTGSVTISSINTFTGPTNLNGGTVIMSGSGTLGTGSTLTLNGGSLNLGTTGQTVGAVSINAPAASGDTISNGNLTGTSYAASNATGNAIISANLLVNATAGFTKTGAGSVTLSGTNTYTGANNINDGSVILSGTGTLGATTAALTLGGGSLNLGTTSQTVAAVSVTTPASSGDTISNGNLTGTSYAASNTTGNAIISANLLANGTAGFAKTGAGTVTLAGTNTFTGAVSFTGGTVVMANTQGLGLPTGSITLNGGVTLDVATAGSDTPYNLTTGSGNSATIVSNVASGNTGINHTFGSTTIGGSTTAGVTQLNIIAGSGITGGSPSITLGSVNMSSGTSAAVITTYNPTTANLIIGSVTNTNGSATNTRTLNLDGNSAGNQITGIIANGASAPTVITKTNSSTWTLSGANTYTGATTVSAGKLAIASTGTINTSAGVTINGATANLNYNSSTALSTPVTLTAGTISGTGTINSALTVETNGIQSPGNSLGNQVFGGGLTWANGGTYMWEVNSWTNTPVAGTNFDQLQVTAGGLNIGSLTAGSFPTNTFKIDINGLTAGNSIGAVPGFDNTQARSWTILTSNAITGTFNANLFTLDTTNFATANPLGGGNFSLANVGNDLVLNFNVATGGNPNLAVAVTSGTVTYGGVLRNGNVANAGITLTNTGGATTDISANTITGFTITPPSPQVVATSGTATSTVNLNTGTNGTFNGNLIYTGNPGGVTTAAIVVSGTVGNASFDGTNSSTTFGAPLRTLVAAATNLSSANFESNSINATVTGGGPNKVGTTATILRYDNSSGGAETVSMAWRSRTATEADLVNNPKALLSDVVRVTGMGAPSTDVGTFVLTMTYDLDQPQFAGLNETAIALSGELQLGWFNSNTNQWTNAVNGNIGGTATFAGIGAPTGSTPLGTWGIDTSGVGGTGYVWAVLNHNSDFAVIPEPSTLVLGGLALLGFAGAGLRRRRQRHTVQ